MTTWTKQKLGDVLEKVVGGGTPSKSNPQYWGGSIPWASVKDFEDRSYYLNSTQDYITQEGLDNSASNSISAGTVVMPTRMGLGRVAKTTIGTAINQDLKAIYPNEKITNDFLLWTLIDSGNKLQNMGNGSTVSGIRLEDLRNIVIDVPDIDTQIQISSVLSAYNELVENNEKRIKILEEMAQRLYTEWFVKFKFPGYERVNLVNSPLGKIPEGWEVKKVKELYETSSGGTPSRKNPEEFYSNGSIPWIKTQELNDNYILETEEKISEVALKKSSAKLFPKNTVLIAMYGATIGKLGILSEESTTNQACCAFLIKERYFSSYYIFQFLKENIKKLTSLAFGGAQPNVSQTTIGNLQILKPTESILNLYNKKSQLVFNEILILQQQIKNLSKTRDLLIPQLITGKLVLKA